MMGSGEGTSPFAITLVTDACAECWDWFEKASTTAGVILYDSADWPFPILKIRQHPKYDNYPEICSFSGEWPRRRRARCRCGDRRSRAQAWAIFYARWPISRVIIYYDCGVVGARHHAFRSHHFRDKERSQLGIMIFLSLYLMTLIWLRPLQPALVPPRIPAAQAEPGWPKVCRAWVPRPVSACPRRYAAEKSSRFRRASRPRPGRCSRGLEDSILEIWRKSGSLGILALNS